MTDDRKELRRLSKALLGGRYQAEVGAAIADAGGSVWGDALLRALGQSAPAKGQISTELHRLEQVQLLVPGESDPYDRRRLLSPADRGSAYWTLCKELRDATGAEPGAQNS